MFEIIFIWIPSFLLIVYFIGFIYCLLSDSNSKKRFSLRKKLKKGV